MVNPDIGLSPVVDIDFIESRTRYLRALDHRLGGGSCLDELLTLIHRVKTPPSADIGQRRLDVALADLHNLTGWVYFDLGMTSRAHVHLSQALAFAGHGRDDRLVADIFYRLGRIRLHEGNPAEALDYFGAGQLMAAKPGCEQAAGILSVSQAWAHAAMGDEHQATTSMQRGAVQFAQAAGGDSPDWSTFFTSIYMQAMIGTVHTELAHRVDPRHARIAIPALTVAVTDYGNDMARSRTFSLISLAMSHFVDGDVDRGVEVGFSALASAENLASVRVRDCMRPLKKDADLHDSHRGARELAARVADFTADHGPMS
jgi:hypothetical protein